MLTRSESHVVRFAAARGWRWFVGGAGKVLIALGVLLFGFVGYQLWGTGIETELAQRRLEDDFDQMLAAVAEPPDTEVQLGPSDSVVLPASTAAASGDAARGADSDADGHEGVEVGGAEPESPTSTAVPVDEQHLPELDDGSALARLEIPAIGVNDIVVAGIGVSELKKGPGHFPDTPLPGQLGNAAIAGHRTTYGAPFFDVDQLAVGDEVIVTTLEGRYVYEVSNQQIVEPSEYEVVATSDPTHASLTLVSCDPKYTARNRIIVTALLNVQRSGAIGEPLLNYGLPAVTPPSGVEASEADAVATTEVTERAGANATDPTGGASGSLLDAVPTATPPVVSDDEAVDGLAEAFGQGWFSDPAANIHVGAWGVLLTGVAVAAWRISRRTGRDLVGAVVGIGPFVLVLFFFYQNVNRLLPPGL